MCSDTLMLVAFVAFYVSFGHAQKPQASWGSIYNIYLTDNTDYLEESIHPYSNNASFTKVFTCSTFSTLRLVSGSYDVETSDTLIIRGVGYSGSGTFRPTDYDSVTWLYFESDSSGVKNGWNVTFRCVRYTQTPTRVTATEPSTCLPFNYLLIDDNRTYTLESSHPYT
eukprot:PhF_6_TR28240/c0_g1_i1/m.41770